MESKRSNLCNVANILLRFGWTLRSLCFLITSLIFRLGLFVFDWQFYFFIIAVQLPDQLNQKLYSNLYPKIKKIRILIALYRSFIRIKGAIVSDKCCGTLYTVKDKKQKNISHNCQIKRVKQRGLEHFFLFSLVSEL